MATKTKNKSAGTDEFAAPRAASAPIVRKTKDTEPNPLDGHFVAAQSAGEPMELDVRSGEQAKRASALMRRAQNHHGGGLKVQFRDASGNVVPSVVSEDGSKRETEWSRLDNGGVMIYEVTETKRSRAYTADDIRKFARERGYEKKWYEPKITTELRDEFKEWFHAGQNGDVQEESDELEDESTE